MYSLIVDPLDSFAFVPHALPLCTLRSDKYAFTLLLTVGPLSPVASAIRVGIDSVAFLLIIFVLSFVLSAIGPLVDSLSVHIVVEPVPLIITAIVPLVDTIA